MPEPGPYAFLGPPQAAIQGMAAAARTNARCQRGWRLPGRNREQLAPRGDRAREEGHPGSRVHRGVADDPPHEKPTGHREDPSGNRRDLRDSSPLRPGERQPVSSSAFRLIAHIRHHRGTTYRHSGQEAMWFSRRPSRRTPGASSRRSDRSAYTRYTRTPRAKPHPGLVPKGACFQGRDLPAAQPCGDAAARASAQLRASIASRTASCAWSTTHNA